MFVRKVIKKNKAAGKTYEYYRLTHSYIVDNKTRQRVVLNLGILEDLPRDKHKLLADKFE